MLSMLAGLEGAKFSWREPNSCFLIHSAAPLMARYSWKGFLRLSLVSVPVQAFNAVQSDEGKIQLHQLHDKDHSRIRYVKVCPQHGEIPTSEIVSGYEVSKDEYVVIQPSELDTLRTPAEKAITLDSFIA